MKYLKKYNEELSPYVYKTTANKLREIGHNKRADKLDLWDDSEQYKLTKKLTDKRLLNASKLGTYRMKLLDKSGKVMTEGNFYVWFSIEPMGFDERYNVWRENGDSLELPIILGVIPVDDDTINKCLEFLDLDDFSYKTYYSNWMYINLSKWYDTDNTTDPILDPSGKLTFDTLSDYKAIFSDRNSAVKFRNLLIGVLNGDILLDENPENDIRDWLMTELCDERDRTLDEFKRVIDSMKSININKLYKD